jgi:hypothetical protein
MSKRGAVAVDRGKALKYLRMIKVDFQRSSEPRSKAYPLRNTGVLKVISLDSRWRTIRRVTVAHFEAAEVGETTFIEKLRQSIQRPKLLQRTAREIEGASLWPCLFDDQPNRSDKR